jgi:S-formylglutathione hydrolase
VECIERHACFGGMQEVWRHESRVLDCGMNFGIYLPPRAMAGQLCPALYFLSGLTCTEQNVITKSGVQAWAARAGLAVIAPDTSPRGKSVPDDIAYDLGQGAGFYVDATEPRWRPHYQMGSYVAYELPTLIERHFPVSDRRGLTGHSMGGHGAIVTALRGPSRWHSISAFSPIVAPSKVPWGTKAFSCYLGTNRDSWAAWDATDLVRASGQGPPILIDQGEADEFLQEQLRPELFEAACAEAGRHLTLRRHRGYDHSYYFIASFIGDHVAHHAAALTHE